MADAELYAWSDGGLNRVVVREAGPVHVLVEARHGPTATVVRLHHSQVAHLAAALSAYVERTAPLAVVEQVLRLNSMGIIGEHSMAVWVVEALAAQGFLPSEDAPPST